MHGPQHPLGEGETLVERAEHEIALVLGLQVQPLLDDVAVDGHPVAPQLDHPVHHQEVVVQVEELAVRAPQLREVAVELVLVLLEDLLALGEPGRLLVQ
ncbi:MAG: hypothetical protein ACK559_17910, partial [bacterium]